MNEKTTKDAAETYLDDPLPFLKSVLGACSITKTILHAYDLVPSDPDDRDHDYRAWSARMKDLCRALALAGAGERLLDLDVLLDLLDAFSAQERRVTARQEAFAALLNRAYVAWCKAAFFEPDTHGSVA